MRRLYLTNFPYLFFTAISAFDFFFFVMLNILLSLVLTYLPAPRYSIIIFSINQFYANAKNVFVHAMAVTEMHCALPEKI